MHSIVVPGVSERVRGVWSLWRVSLQSTVAREQRFLSVFVSDDGRALAPTARSVWDRLIDLPIGLAEQDVHLAGSDAATAYETARQAAEAQGAVVFSELLDAHRAAMLRERRKGEYAFAARRSAVERIGLLQVKAHRRAALDEEERSWIAELAAREAALPDLSAVLLLRVGGIGGAS